jgi:hypothetical protein
VVEVDFVAVSEGVAAVGVAVGAGVVVAREGRMAIRSGSP